jgi:acyl dehydratase
MYNGLQSVNFAWDNGLKSVVREKNFGRFLIAVRKFDFFRNQIFFIPLRQIIFQMQTETTKNLIEAGDIYRHKFVYSQEQVNQFADVTGDKNPVHIDAEYAAKTMFGRTIMHGFLGGSVFSMIFGTLFPGEGTIYLEQNMKFKRPMIPGTEYEAVMTVKEVNREKNSAVVETNIIDIASGKPTVEGSAVVMNKTRL